MNNIIRPSIKFIEGNLKGELIGVEIGVWRGENAEKILQNLSIKKLYLIDPYDAYKSYILPPTKDLTKDEEIAQEKLAKFKDKIRFIKLKASDAVHLIPDELDFVYIDGNHTYEYVKQDIENYWPKIKKGGVIGGHDYNAKEPGINKAVDEFVKNKKTRLYIKPYDWWIVK